MRSVVGLLVAATLVACAGADRAPPTSADLGPVYLVADGIEFEMDVRVPSTPGPWPVVVAFHGVSSAGNDAETLTAVADAAASNFLVFTPDWLGPDPFPIDEASIESLRRTGACAVAVAQARSVALGGDPGRTLTYGFSAGTGPALAAILGAGDVDLTGCAVDALAEPVRGVVAGDGEYFWQSENFDAVFDAAPSTMRAEMERTISPSGLADARGVPVRLWFAADRTAPRALPAGSEESDWLSVRDSDGSIRADLVAAGLLDDGIVDYGDQAELFALRLERAGADVSLVEYPGGHTTLDKVADLDGLLSATASEL